MSTVWIVKNTGYDFSPSLEFGEGRFLLESANGNPFATEDIKAELERRMPEVQPGDSLLMAGPPIMCALAYHAFKEHLGSVRVLLFHARKRLYIERTL